MVSELNLNFFFLIWQESNPVPLENLKICLNHCTTRLYGGRQPFCLYREQNIVLSRFSSQSGSAKCCKNTKDNTSEMKECSAMGFCSTSRILNNIFVCSDLFWFLFRLASYVHSNNINCALRFLRRRGRQATESPEIGALI